MDMPNPASPTPSASPARSQARNRLLPVRLSPRGVALTGLFGGLLLALLQACSTAVEEDTAAVQPGFTSCETPRPEMCTREFQPVCGHIDTGIRCVTTPCPATARHKTYGNACTACADNSVIGFEQGSCESYGK
ncbi:hypothetical protein GCM10027567_14330 [Spongiibacter taiwanensis]